jgi:hypothetical protein
MTSFCPRALAPSQPSLPLASAVEQFAAPVQPVGTPKPGLCNQSLSGAAA